MLNKNLNDSRVKCIFSNDGPILDIEDYIEVIYQNEKKYLRCTGCHKVYEMKNRSNLKSHIESKHVTGVKYSCEYCNAMFRTRQRLLGHTRQHHNLITNNKNFA